MATSTKKPPPRTTKQAVYKTTKTAVVTKPVDNKSSVVITAKTPTASNVEKPHVNKTAPGKSSSSSKKLKSKPAAPRATKPAAVKEDRPADSKTSTVSPANGRRTARKARKTAKPATPRAAKPAVVRAGKPVAAKNSDKKALRLPGFQTTQRIRAPLPGPEIKRAAKKTLKNTGVKVAPPPTGPLPSTPTHRPLDRILVLDLSCLLPGPYASHILANFGAQVIKIESVGEGDYYRDYEPKIDDKGAVFSTINRGKKSIALNLKEAHGKEAFHALVRKADVIIDGFRPGVMEKLGLDYSKLKELNPKLIYAALTGYGQTGSNAYQAGHDLNYIASGGLLDLFGESNGIPLQPGIQIADVAAGALPTVIGILLALQHRNTSKKGQLVDIAMLDGVLALMPVQIANYAATKRRPKRGHERLFGRYACYNIYPVRNGRYLAVAALEPKFWKALCECLQRTDLIAEQYAEHKDQEILTAELTRTFQKKTVDEWMEIFGENDICVTEVRDISRAVQDESLIERGIIIANREGNGDVYEQLGVFPRLKDTPGYTSGKAPARGEHTRQVLLSLKYSTKKIDELISTKVAEEPSSSKK